MKTAPFILIINLTLALMAFGGGLNKDDIQKLEQQRDIKRLEACLKADAIDTRLLAAESLSKLKDPSSEKALISALRENQYEGISNTEQQINQQKINEVIIDALEQISGTKFTGSKKVGSADVRTFLNKVERSQK